MTELEQHYADISNQNLKNIAHGLICELLKQKMPESAGIVQELINRMRASQT